MKNVLVFLLLSFLTIGTQAQLKPRVVILTDIGQPDLEPDDTESLVHLLCYADQLEIEGIVTSTGWNCDPYPTQSAAFRDSVVEGYRTDVHNLMRRSNQKAFLSKDQENGCQEMGYWPSAEYIRSRCVMGSQRAGIKVIGKDNDSEGSELIISLADEKDERPIWVCAWGGANTLAQAIWKVKQTRTPEQLKAFLHKLRLYTITDQDMVYAMRMNLAYSSHQWMRREFAKDLLFVWDEGTWQLQCTLGQEHWHQIKEQIQGHAALGKQYPNYKYGVEGDTPSFLNVIPNGLHNPEEPMQAGWGGYHTWSLTKDSTTYAWTSWQDPVKRISEAYYRQFYPDQLNDFIARIEWAETGRGNQNPVAVVNGDKGTDAIVIMAKAGQTITLDASASFDPDGDALTFKWWQQNGIGRTKADISNTTSSSIKVQIPATFTNDEMHIICEVHDDSKHALPAYRRIIIKTTGQPYLEHHDNSTARIVVNGNPMLIIGGELGNSSASTPEDVKRAFAHLHKMGLNTVLVPLSWELIEPQEGTFDMGSLKVVLSEARRNELKVVLLWFGAWKNSMSCYAPEWFKRDTKRFPRVHTSEGKPVEEASSLSKNVLEADKRAFCHIMAYLRDHDAHEQTVIMVQVENEIGMIEVPRDYSADATRLYQSTVPQQLTDYLKKHQKTLHPYLKEKLQPQAKAGANWPQLFGDDIYTEEIFQTWTYATYVEQIAKAGREIYNLPMYVNVALDSRNRKPGQYPSGGPLAHLIDLWHCGAPSIDVLGVDIYDKGVKSWLTKYHLPNNPLFVPEIRLEDTDAMYALYAFGHHGAMGFCPFSIEDYPLTIASNANDWKQMDLSQDDQLNAFSAVGSSQTPLVASYWLLRQAEPLILERQGTEDMDAVLLDNEQREAEIITPDNIRITVKHSYTLGWEPGAKDAAWPEAACIILRIGKEDYLIIGSGVVVTFSPAESVTTWHKGDQRIGLAKCEEVEIVDGKLHIVRHLNGDQTHQGRHVRIPVGAFQIQHFKLYRYW